MGSDVAAMRRLVAGFDVAAFLGDDVEQVAGVRHEAEPTVVWLGAYEPAERATTTKQAAARVLVAALGAPRVRIWEVE